MTTDADKKFLESLKVLDDSNPDEFLEGLRKAHARFVALMIGFAIAASVIVGAGCWFKVM